MRTWRGVGIRVMTRCVGEWVLVTEASEGQTETFLGPFLGGQAREENSTQSFDLTALLRPWSFGGTGERSEMSEMSEMSEKRERFRRLLELGSGQVPGAAQGFPKDWA